MKVLGVLMLDTRFPRPPGDVGHPDSYAYPVRFQTVTDASPQRVVHARAEGLVDAFCTAAQALEARGCSALLTSCGFMALHQRRLAQAVSVPVAASALLWLPLLRAWYGGRPIGVLTASAHSLSSAHLGAVGAAPDTPVVGVASGGEFERLILGDQGQGDMHRVGEEIVAAAHRLKQKVLGMAALVLECTNMRPYRAAIAAATGVPIYDLVDMADLLMKQADS